ncbi:DNA-binding response regulator [Azoarcus sp. DD4]|uniref:response regulator transcription factor n=1 Tax=Azoarcus sp. DD4 TaxID=2027405 RepID=UPI001128BED4|nr:response regulator transcription factor [Azoarcus sp. DD4]QDF99110.1 DNA-binding response regulator [Azoarcus sp. DD4]
MRLLLIEDDPMIGAAVQRGLRQEGYAVDWVRDGAAGLLALATPAAGGEAPYDLLLLDLGLPGKDGLTVLGELRAAGNPLPVLVLTARDAVSERIRGLDAGADDYLVKPFDLDELAARVRALLRRRAGRPEPIVRQAGIVVDPASHAVSVDGEPVRLSAREFALLQALLEQPGKPLSRAQLEERLYGWGEEVESNAVEVHIHALRRKLGADRIRNLRGVGWFVPREA